MPPVWPTPPRRSLKSAIAPSTPCPLWLWLRRRADGRTLRLPVLHPCPMRPDERHRSHRRRPRRCPTDAYGRSKLAAEEGLAALDLAAVSLRPVVVYGPGCKGNMAVLRRVALSGMPLPLGGLTGRRSDRVAGQCRERRAARPFDRGTLARRDDRGRPGACDSARHDPRLARRRRPAGAPVFHSRSADPRAAWH